MGECWAGKVADKIVINNIHGRTLSFQPFPKAQFATECGIILRVR